MYVFTETEEAGICCEEGGGFTHIHVMIHIPPHVWHDMTRPHSHGWWVPHPHTNTYLHGGCRASLKCGDQGVVCEGRGCDLNVVGPLELDGHTEVAQRCGQWGRWRGRLLLEGMGQKESVTDVVWNV